MSKQQKQKSYEQMNEELAEILAWFEGEQVDLDEALVKYDQASKLLTQMETYLKTARNKIKNIKIAGI